MTPGTVDSQAPLFMGFPRQEYCSGLAFPSAGDLPDPGIKPPSPVSPSLAGRFFTLVSPGKPCEAWISPETFEDLISPAVN